MLTVYTLSNSAVLRPRILNHYTKCTRCDHSFFHPDTHCHIVDHWANTELQKYIWSVFINFVIW